MQRALGFEAYITAKRGSFTGRAWLFTLIEQWLASKSGSRALLITAPPGNGKTAFAAEYVHRFRGSAVLSWHFCQHHQPQTLEPGSFVRSIATQLATAIPDYRSSIEDSPELQTGLDEADSDPAPALENAVLRVLARLPPPQYAQLIVVDALDQALKQPGEFGLVELLTGAAQQFPGWLRLLVTSRPDPGVLTPLEPAFKAQQIGLDGARHLEDLRQHVLACASRHGIQQIVEAEGRSADSLAGLLCAGSGGNFVFVQHALRELATGAVPIETLEQMPADGMDALYRVSLGRRFGQRAESYTQARALLGVMCAACEPLTPAELAQILGVSESQILGLAQELADFIQLDSEDERCLVSFVEPAFKEWLTQKKAGQPRAADFAVNLPQAHSSLYRWAVRRVEADDAHTSAYLLRHLTSHLKDDVERQAVYARLLLESFAWSQAQVESRGWRSLLADVAHIRALPEAPWLRALICQAAPALSQSGAHCEWPAQVLGRLGVGRGNIGLPELATAAQRWGLAHGVLLPRHRSLRWRPVVQRQLEGSSPILALPDGRIAFCRGWDICVCDPGGCAAPQLLSGHTGHITKLGVLSDGRLVSGSADQTVRVWNLKGTASRLLKAHSGEITALAVLPPGRVIFTTRDSNYVWVWEPSDTTARKLKGHTQHITALALTPDGRVVSASDDNTVRLWSLSGAADQVLSMYTEEYLFFGYPWNITALCVLADGRVVTGTESGEVRLWSHKGTAQVFKANDWHVTALAALPDGRFVSSGYNSTVRLWSLDGTDQVLVDDDDSAFCFRFAVLPGGLAVSGSSKVRLLSLTGAAPKVLDTDCYGDDALSVLRDGSLVTAGDCVRVWSLAGLHVQGPEAHAGCVSALTVMPDGRVISAGHDTTLRAWEPDGAARVLSRHTGLVTAMAVLPGGRVVCGSDDGDIRVWSFQGTPTQLLKGHTATVTALGVLPDGRVVSASLDGSVRVWHLAAASPIILEGHSGGVRALATLPDGRVVSAGDDSCIRVWSLSGGAAERLEGHSDWVNALSLLPGGRLVSASHDKSVRLWSLTPSAAPGTARRLEINTGAVTALAALPDGRLVCASRGRSVRVLSTSFELQHSFMADEVISCLAVNASGVIAAGCSDGSVHALCLPPEVPSSAGTALG